MSSDSAWQGCYQQLMYCQEEWLSGSGELLGNNTPPSGCRASLGNSVFSVPRVQVSSFEISLPISSSGYCFLSSHSLLKTPRGLGGKKISWGLRVTLLYQWSPKRGSREPLISNVLARHTSEMATGYGRGAPSDAQLMPENCLCGSFSPVHTETGVQNQYQQLFLKRGHSHWLWKEKKHTHTSSK